jgi:hypothetical protein
MVIDRFNRKAVLIGADLFRAALGGTVHKGSLGIGVVLNTRTLAGWRLVTAPSPIAQTTNPFARVLGRVDLGSLPTLLALVVAAAVGALHAATPGHGKTLRISSERDGPCARPPRSGSSSRSLTRESTAVVADPRRRPLVTGVAGLAVGLALTAQSLSALL